MYFTCIITYCAKTTKSEKIQLLIYNTNDYSVNSGLAVNKNLSLIVQDCLARCDSFFVRRLLARNECISANTKLILSEDESDDISVLIRNNLDRVN